MTAKDELMEFVLSLTEEQVNKILAHMDRLQDALKEGEQDAVA